jgi:hypothetical protein
LSFLRDTFLGRETPEETLEDFAIWPAVHSWWSETLGNNGTYISPAIAEKVWAANRCIQLNSQQIASMPLQFQSEAPMGGFEPAWVSNPDPAWFPNGISDAMFAAVEAIYGYGYTLLYVLDSYANGYPSSWTVVDPRIANVNARNGRRVYKAGETELDPMRVVQIDRDPGRDLHGTSAIRSFASQAWSLIASGELGRGLMSGGVPAYYLQSERKLTEPQALALQAQWVARTTDRGGAPPVVPPEIAPKQLSFSPADLLLLEAQEFNAKAVAAAFGVPAVFLNLSVEGSHVYQSPAMLGEMWWRFELRPLAKRIADALSAQMLPRGNWVTFDASDTFAPIVQEGIPGTQAEEDDPQLANKPATSAATPNQNGNVLHLQGVGA